MDIQSKNIFIMQHAYKLFNPLLIHLFIYFPPSIYWLFIFGF